MYILIYIYTYIYIGVEWHWDPITSTAYPGDIVIQQKALTIMESSLQNFMKLQNDHVNPTEHENVINLLKKDIIALEIKIKKSQIKSKEAKYSGVFMLYVYECGHIYIYIHVYIYLYIHM
jgi:hypothetical protein